MNRTFLILLLGFALVITTQHANAQHDRRYLDEYCRAAGRLHIDTLCGAAEYIVVAECVEQGSVPDKGLSWVRLKIESVYKAPESNPKPDIIEVKASWGLGHGLDYRKGKRYFAFVYKRNYGGPGYCIEITEDDELRYCSSSICSFCLEKIKLDTLDHLTKHVKHILSGEYEKELLERINDKKLDKRVRRSNVIALCRTNPSSAIEPLVQFLLEFPEKDDNSPGNILSTMFWIDPFHTKELCIQILSTDSIGWYLRATENLARPEWKLDDLEKHYPMLIKATEVWKKTAPDSYSAYTSMLPVFVNNNCRTPEVKRMLLELLAIPDALTYRNLLKSTFQLQFPETLPLYWDHIKSESLTSDLYYPHRLIASHVGARAIIYDELDFEPLDEPKAKSLISQSYPEYSGCFTDAEIIPMDKSFLFLLKDSKGENPACFYVGFVETGRTNEGISSFKHQAFMLFGDKYLPPARPY